MGKEKDIDIKKAISALRVGLYGVESKADGGYIAVNRTPQVNSKGEEGKPTYALGKYQFVPRWHWDNIAKHAKKHYNLDLPKYSPNMDPAVYNQFLNNKALQESFFEEYVQETLVPIAKNLEKQQERYGKTEHSFDELLALGHYVGNYGPGENNHARQYLSTGDPKFRPGGNNLPIGDYIGRYSKDIAEAGIEKIPSSVNKSSSEIFQEWNGRVRDINSNPDFTQETKQLLMEELNKEFFKKGHISVDQNGKTFGPLIDEINKQNEKREAAFIQKENNLNEVIDFLSNEKVQTKIVFEKDQNGYSFQINIPKDQDLINQWNRIADKNSDILEPISNKNFKKGIQKFEAYSFRGHHIENDRFISRLNNDAQDVGIVEEGHLLFAPEDLDRTSVMKRIDEEVKKNEAEIKKINRSRRSSSVFPTKIEANTEVPIRLEKKESNPENMMLITSPAFDPLWLQDDDEIIKGEGEGESADSTDAVNTEKELDERAKEKADSSITDFIFSQDSMEPAKPNIPDQKGSFPFLETATSLATAAYGFAEAKKKSEPRDERVSEAYMNYTQELKKLSEIGLRPEEEAYAKKMLTDSYSISIENLVRASAGNRNVVLGGLGRVDAQNSDALLKLSLADAEAKRQAFFMYGEATKYINEFDANRDIANNERKYNETMLGKQAGGQLAGASLRNMLDTIRHEKQFGKGSLHDAQKQYIMKSLYGDFWDNPEAAEADYQERKMQHEMNEENRKWYMDQAPEVKSEINEWYRQGRSFNDLQEHVKERRSNQGTIKLTDEEAGRKPNIHQYGLPKFEPETMPDNASHEKPMFQLPDQKKPEDNFLKKLLGQDDEDAFAFQKDKKQSPIGGDSIINQIYT